MGMFSKATKGGFWLRLALAGPSGSGKTYTSLLMAEELAKRSDSRIALIDTENQSSRRYADRFDFDALYLDDSHHPDRYVEAIEAAIGEGYRVIVVDSLSHAWIGIDGILKLVERSRERNDFAKWRHVTPIHDRLVAALVNARAHIVATMRSKTAYEVSDDGKGKKAPKKIGAAPVQREGVEYEFDCVGDLMLDHGRNTIEFSKSRCPALRGRIWEDPGADVAAILHEWSTDDGAPPTESERPASNGAKPLSDEQAEFFDLAKTALDVGFFADRAAISAWTERGWSAKPNQLTDQQCSEAQQDLETELDEWRTSSKSAALEAARGEVLDRDDI